MKELKGTFRGILVGESLFVVKFAAKEVLLALDVLLRADIVAIVLFNPYSTISGRSLCSYHVA